MLSGCLWTVKNDFEKSFASPFKFFVTDLDHSLREMLERSNLQVFKTRMAVPVQSHNAELQWKKTKNEFDLIMRMIIRPGTR